jgi:hypothetical protein
MMMHESVEVTLDGAIDLIQEELAEAAEALRTEGIEGALKGYVGALGLALQLGPAATERVLGILLGVAHELAQQNEAEGLSALGPAMVGLVDQVRQANVLPATELMAAWATVAADLGALIGQIGLALTIPDRHRPALLDSARARAALLDDATANRFALTAWLDGIR